MYRMMLSICNHCEPISQHEGINLSMKCEDWCPLFKHHIHSCTTLSITNNKAYSLHGISIELLDVCSGQATGQVTQGGEEGTVDTCVRLQIPGLLHFIEDGVRLGRQTQDIPHWVGH